MALKKLSNSSQTNEAVFLVDLDHLNILYLNASARQQLGYPCDADLSLRLPDIIPDCILLSDRIKQSKSEPALTLKTRLLGKNGQPIPIELHFETFALKENFLGIAIARPSTEYSGSSTERILYRQVLEESADFFSCFNMQGQLLYHNLCATRMLGFPDETALSDASIATIYPKWMVNQWTEVIIPALLKHNHWRGDAALLHRDGHEIPVFQTLVLHRNTHSEPAYISVTLSALADRKEKEEQLDLFAYVFNHVNEAIFLVDEHARFVQVNDKACNSLGYTRDELLTMRVFDIDPDFKPVDWQQQKVDPGEHRWTAIVETRHRSKQGRTFPVEVNASFICYRGHNYSLAIVRDISERKSAQEKLNLLSYALNHVKEAAWLIDEQARFHYCNAEACHSLGYTQCEMLNLSVPDIDPCYQWEVWPNQWLVIKTEGSLTFESLHKPKSGDEFPVEINANYFEYNGQSFILALVRNITERIQHQQALQHSESWLNAAQRITHIGSWEVDFSSGILSWTDETFRIWEISPSEFGASVEAFLNTVHPEDRDKVAKAYNAAVANKTLYQIEHRLLFPDGRIKFIAERGEPVCDEAGNITSFVGTAMDITERHYRDETLKFVAQQGWKHHHTSFLVALCEYLAQLFQVRYVIIDKLMPSIESAETIVLYANGNLLPNIQYMLKNTPCAEVVNGRFCCYPEKVQQNFPEDHLLTEMGAESYAGLPLWNTAGQVIGLIGVIDTKPFSNTALISSILQLVTSSVAAEIERQQAEQVLAAREREFRILVETAPAPIFRYDRDCRRIYLNPAVEKMTDKPASDLLQRKPSDGSILCKSEGKKLERALRQVIETGQTYEGELECVFANGETHYFHNRYAPELDENNQVLSVILVSYDITERKRMETAILQREQEFRALVENLPTVVLRYDRNLNYVYGNTSYLQLIGSTEAELRNRTIEQNWLASNISAEEYRNILRNVLCSGEKQEVTLEWKDKKGNWVCYMVKIVPEYTFEGQIQTVLALGFDFSERYRQQLVENNRQRVFEKMARNNNLETILEQVALYVESVKQGGYCAILLFDEDSHRLQLAVAPSFPRSYCGKKQSVHLRDKEGLCQGWAASARDKRRVIIQNLNNRSCADLCEPFIREIGAGACWSEPIISSANQLLGVVTLYLEQSGEPDDADLGHLLKAARLSAIAIERNRIEQRLMHQASYDALTELPNRHMFYNRLEEEINKSNRNKHAVALLFIDLDRFKDVNDTLGHALGDALLINASQRIRECVGQSDMVARLGGDEFVIITPVINSVSSSECIVEAILNRMAEPFSIQEYRIYVSASIGIAIYPQDADTVEGLVSCADQAMYAAKESGRNNFSFFTQSMQALAQQRLYLINALREAIKKDQLEVHYQPIIEVASGKAMKAEALVRWRHPSLGMVSPAEFIPLAEETDLIQEIGNWIFSQAADMSKHWNQQLDGEVRKISINMSPRQLIKGSGDQMTLDYLQTIDLNSKYIVIEITEGLLLDNSSTVVQKLDRLKQAGVELSLDDFGTGYSAMAYLKKFNIDYLKIDRSFIRELETNPDDRAITEAIIVMAHRLGLKVIAEGVETEEQYSLLSSLSCEYIQGYYFSKPMPPEAFLTYVLEGE